MCIPISMPSPILLWTDITFLLVEYWHIWFVHHWFLHHGHPTTMNGIPVATHLLLFLSDSSCDLIMDANDTCWWGGTEGCCLLPDLQCNHHNTSHVTHHYVPIPYFSSTGFLVVALGLFLEAFFLFCLSSASASAMRPLIETTTAGDDDSGVPLQ